MDAGEEQLALDQRSTFQRLMGAKAIATIERLSGRTVSASMSTNHIDPDLALETFVLVPAHVEAPAGPDGHPPGWPA